MIWRIRAFFLRLLDYILSLPHRFIRFITWMFWIPPLKGKNKLLRWISGLFFLGVDITPIPFLIECALDWVKLKTRSLNEHEKEIAKEVFGVSLPVHLIGVDPSSIPAKKKKTVAFVTFHTVNFDTKIPDPTFIHELVHIWQYRKYGAAYITESIWAQKWGGGYNYGGADELMKHSEGSGLRAFNFEQQADIVEEYFRWKHNLALQWAPKKPEVGEVLSKYRDQVSAA